MRLHIQNSFRNLIISNWNQIVHIIFRLIWNQTDVRLVPNQSANDIYNLISVWFNEISKRILYVCDLVFLWTIIIETLGVFVNYFHCKSYHGESFLATPQATISYPVIFKICHVHHVVSYNSYCIETLILKIFSNYAL